MARPQECPQEDVLKEELSASRELAWLIDLLPGTTENVRSILQECSNLLTPNTSSTLALSSPRSESLKGYATRAANKVIKSDMQVKMYGLPNTKGFTCYKLSLDPKGKGVMLEQLTDVGNHVRESLDILDGGADVEEKLRRALRNVSAAREALRGTREYRLFPYRAVDPTVFDPPLHPQLAFDLYISEGALIVELRTLDPLAPSEHRKSAFALTALETPFGLRGRFAAAVGLRNGPDGSGTNGHDQVYSYKGGDTRVRERVRVESQDPSLMAVSTKLFVSERMLHVAVMLLDVAKSSVGVGH